MIRELFAGLTVSEILTVGWLIWTGFVLGDFLAAHRWRARCAEIDATWRATNERLMQTIENGFVQAAVTLAEAERAKRAEEET